MHNVLDQINLCLCPEQGHAVRHKRERDGETEWLHWFKRERSWRRFYTFACPLHIHKKTISPIFWASQLSGHWRHLANGAKNHENSLTSFNIHEIKHQNQNASTSNVYFGGSNRHLQHEGTCIWRNVNFSTYVYVYIHKHTNIIYIVAIFHYIFVCLVPQNNTMALHHHQPWQHTRLLQRQSFQPLPNARLHEAGSMSAVE